METGEPAVEDDADRDWMSRERTALWKLGASVAWFGMVMAFIFISVALAGAKSNYNQMGETIGKVASAALVVGCCVIITRPKKTRRAVGRAEGTLSGMASENFSFVTQAQSLWILSSRCTRLIPKPFVRHGE